MMQTRTIKNLISKIKNLRDDFSIEIFGMRFDDLDRTNKDAVIKQIEMLVRIDI